MCAWMSVSVCMVVYDVFGVAGIVFKLSSTLCYKIILSRFENEENSLINNRILRE